MRTSTQAEIGQPMEMDDLVGSGGIRLVRLRLWLALVTMFVIPLAIAAPVLYGLAVGQGAPMILPTLLIAGLAMVLGLLTVFLARRVLEPAENLDRARAWLREAYERARLEALRDPLTGLGNHRAFHEELDRQISTARRYGTDFSLVLVDIDEFKRVNDTLGHAGGDVLLEGAARLMTAMLRRADRAFRVGGDEFALLLPHTDAEGARISIRRILSAALEGGGGGVTVGAFSFSAGISAIPANASDREALYRQADAALYWGKRHGRTSVHVFDPARHAAVARTRPLAELSAALATVVAERLVRAVFQPIFDLETGAITGYEGLVRPTRGSGFEDPGGLFAAAESLGRTTDLDLACVDVILGTAVRLGLEGNLSVNLSPRTLEAEEFTPGALGRIIGRHGVDPARVVVEVTERESVEDLDRVQAVIDGLRRLGLRIAADDIGAGNAGLRLLSQIRFDIVKIDLSLVQGGAIRSSSLEVLRTLRDLADRWHAPVVAEGVETSDQLRVVRSLGIGSAQGYLLARPTDEPTTEPIDLDELTRPSDWLAQLLAGQPSAAA